MSAEAADDIIRLATASNPPQAHIWEQALTAAGIRCRVVGEYLEGGLGDLPGARPEVWVHRQDAQRAEEILREGPHPGSASPREA